MAEVECLNRIILKYRDWNCTCEKFLNDLKKNLFPKFSFLRENKYFFN